MTEDEQIPDGGQLQRLQEAETYLEAGLQDGTVTERFYHMGMVALARDYFCDLRMLVKGTELLTRVKPEYFKYQQRLDMAEDPDYKQVVVDLATALVLLGLIDVEAQLRPTQPPAKA